MLTALLLYIAWRLLAPLVRALPVPLTYALGGAIVECSMLAWPSGRRALRENLAVVLNTRDRRIIDYWAGRHCRRYGEYLIDAIQLDSHTPQECRAAVETDDWPALEQAAAEGPLILALMHCGNWDVAGGAVATRIGPPIVLVGSLGHPRLDAAVQGARARIGMRPMPVEAGTLPVLRALKAGATVGILFDRPLSPAEPGIDVTFFDHPCRLPTGLARLALASGARVIPVAPIRRSSRAFRFQALLDLDFCYRPTADRDHDVRALTQAVLDVYERWVRRYPDQWYQFRRFFLPYPAGPLPQDTDSVPTGIENP